ncbi:MAG: ABC transporter ATP-binding protein [Lachnospiraceae bacterium]
MSILELKNISYQYEGTNKKVLSGINLSFESGTLYAIMGKSGSGKTTLLSLLSGLDLPTGGELLYKGMDLQKMDRDNYRAKKIGVIFQGYNLLTNATVLENILLSMNISGVKEKNKRQTALELLRKVGINEEKASRKTLKLSGGEQQRVGIARALAHHPDIILADEPTGNLDGDNENGIMDIFKELAREQGKCVIVVTHSKNVASYADKVIQLHEINRKAK